MVPHRHVLRWLTSRWTLIALYFIALAPSLFLALSQPLWSLVDEAAHYDVVAQYAHAVVPRVAETPVRSETLSLDTRTGVFGYYLIVGPKPDASLAPFAPPPEGISISARALYNQRHVWELSYEAIQPPLYYILVTPIWMAGNAIWGAYGAAYALRVTQALILAAMAPLTYLLAWEVRPSRRVALTAGLLIAFLPGFVLAGTSINNDGLVAVLGTVALLVTCRAARLGWTAKRAAAVGAIFSVACLVKPDCLGLAPALAFATFLPIPRARTQLMVRLRAALVMSAVSTVGLGLWIGMTYAQYGSPTTYAPGRKLVANDTSRIQHVFLGELFDNLRNLAETTIVGEPLALTYGALSGILPIFAALCGVALAGLISLFLVKRLRVMVKNEAVVILAVAFVSETIFTVSLPALTHDAYLTPGRYIFSAIGGMAALVAVGGWLAVGQRAVTTASFGAVALLGAVSIAVYPQNLHVPSAVGAGHPLRGTTVVPVDSHVRINGIDIALDEYAHSRSEHWLHVTIKNFSEQMMEWTPLLATPYLAHLVPVTNYLLSTPFPQELRPSGTISGWFRLADNQAYYGHPIVLVLPSVATDNYHELANAVLQTTLEKP